MRITPLTSSFVSRAGRRAAAGRASVEAPSAQDLGDRAVAPATASDTIDPDRRPLPVDRALVPTAPVVTRAADTLAALRAYAAPTRHASAFPAGSLLRLAV